MCDNNKVMHCPAFRDTQTRFDQVPDTMRLALGRRRLIDGYVTSDVHPAVWMLVQCHIARGTLTWGDLVKDNVSRASVRCTA